MSSTPKTSKDKNRVLSESSAIYILQFSTILLILGIIIFLLFGSWKFNNTLDEAKVAQFGDFIGGVVGSLFTLVGVILFYVALKEQRKDVETNQAAVRLQLQAFNQQITEFQEQRKELESTRKIYEQQTKTMKNQQFDSNFYSLLNVYISIKRNLDAINPGVDYFEEKFEKLLETTAFEEGQSLIDLHSQLIANYEEIFLSSRGQLSQYFKTIYRLLKMIDECEHLTDDEKIFYAKILRSQVTNSELMLLYYNYHSSFGQRVQSLILKYDFLKHLETLSKAEFIKKFQINSAEKSQLILFTDKLKNFVSINIKASKDIENTENIDFTEKYEKEDIMVGIIIDENVQVSVRIPKDETHILGLTVDQFKEYIYLFLNDELYFNKFVKTDNSEITKSTTIDDNYLKINYTITKY